MQSVPAHRNLAASNPKKTAKIDNGRTYQPRRIDHDVDDTTHVLAISPLYRPAKDSPHCRTIDNSNGRFCRRRRRFRLGIIRGWHDLRQSYQQNRSHDDANVAWLRAHEATLSDRDDEISRRSQMMSQRRNLLTRALLSTDQKTNRNGVRRQTDQAARLLRRFISRNISS